MNYKNTIFVWVTAGNLLLINCQGAMRHSTAASTEAKTVLAAFREEHRHGNRPIGIWDKGQASPNNTACWQKDE